MNTPSPSAQETDASRQTPALPSDSDDWRRLIAGGVGTIERLPGHLVNTSRETLAQVAQHFPMRINHYYLSRIMAHDDPLGRQVLPAAEELDDMDGPIDPLAEESQSPVSQLIHRYPHRVAFLVSDQCAVYCRFCMRKRRVGTKTRITDSQIGEALEYIAKHPAIHEVVLTGGDPLMLEDDRLTDILQSLRQMDQVQVLRIHSRMPVVLPQRVTPALVDALARCQPVPVYVNIHINHPAELTSEVAAACARLADAGIPLGSQTVMLKGVNDNAQTLTELMEQLLRHRIRPYYIHQLDRVPGTAHFQVPLQQSIDLIHSLRGPLSGMAIPHLMVDLHQGGGKMALTGDSIVEKGSGSWKIRNWQGKIHTHPA